MKPMLPPEYIVVPLVNGVEGIYAISTKEGFVGVLLDSPGGQRKLCVAVPHPVNTDAELLNTLQGIAGAKSLAANLTELGNMLKQAIRGPMGPGPTDPPPAAPTTGKEKVE